MRAVLLQHARAEYKALLDLTEERHRNFARRHGMEYVRVDGTAMPGRTGHWDGLLLMWAGLLFGAEAVLWVDADALIVGDEDWQRIKPGQGIRMARHPGPPEHWNCGVMLAQSGQAGPGRRVVDFLQETILLGPGRYPWYQQQIMNDLAQLPQWEGIIQRLPDRWNSTLGVNEAERPVIVAWHGVSGAEEKLAAMKRWMGKNC